MSALSVVALTPVKTKEDFYYQTVGLLPKFAIAALPSVIHTRLSDSLSFMYKCDQVVYGMPYILSYLRTFYKIDFNFSTVELVQLPEKIERPDFLYEEGTQKPKFIVYPDTYYPEVDQYFAIKYDGVKYTAIYDLL